MKKIISIDTRDDYYIITIRYSRGWLGRLFLGEKEKEVTYVSLSNYSKFSYTDILLYSNLFSFTDSDGREANYYDTIFMNKAIKERVKKELDNRIVLKNKEKYNLIMSKTENKS